MSTKRSRGLWVPRLPALRAGAARRADINCPGPGGDLVAKTMMNDDAVEAIGEVAPGVPARLHRAVAAMVRWIGWWMATGVVAFSGAVSIGATARSRTLEFQSVATLAGMAIAGVALGALLWRRRRSTDGAVAAMVLTAGFWIALWLVVWALPHD